MSLKPIPVLLLLLLFFSKSFGQNPDIKQQIAEKLNNYFLLERENIHLHLNKDLYLSEENIWFKGYVFNRKQLVPFYSTTNIFVVLFNETGTKINQKLVYGNTGTFEGAFTNLNQLPSGNYYIQVYTNWMNNFHEDESNVYPIKIINASNPDFFDTKKSDLSTARIEINPEGGTFVNGIANVIGVKVVDRFNNPVGNLTAELKNEANQILAEVAINSDGLGRFFITPKNDSYSLSIIINGNLIEKQLPIPSAKGIAMEVNSYTITDKATIKISTNVETFKDLVAKKLFVVMHQDERALIFDVNIDPTSLEHILKFSTETISPGINIVRLLDENSNQLAERIIYKLPNIEEPLTFDKKTDQNGSIKIIGQINQADVNLSVSILPANSLANNFKRTIAADFYYNSFLLEPIKKLAYYSKDINGTKKYELDLVLLNQTKAKYQWNDILKNIPINPNEFDEGLTVKGNLLSPTLKDASAYKIRLRSFHHLISVHSQISKSGDFEFKKLILNDSATVDFGLFKNTDVAPLKLNYTAKITNGDRYFKFAFKGYTSSDLSQPKNSIVAELPKFDADIIELNTVEIKANKFALTRAKSPENNNLRGYKVPENTTTSVLNYIQENGFTVKNGGNSVDIISRSTFSGEARPIVFVDDFQVEDFSFLRSIWMNQLDEIYINANALVPSVRNNKGIIRMYRKTPIFSAPKDNLKYTKLINGFSVSPKFENSKYSSTLSDGFKFYGVVNWISTILLDDKKTFEIEIPNYNQKKVEVIIEGFTYDGQIISETHTIDL